MADPQYELLRGFPLVIEIPLAWGEMDAFQHLNNAVYFRYFESARIAYFQQIGFFGTAETDGIGPILASTTCRFKLPLTYPDTVSVGTTITNIEQDRFTMRYVIVSQRHRRVAAEGEGIVVSYDYHAQRKAPLPDAVRARITAFEQGAQGEA